MRRALRLTLPFLTLLVSVGAVLAAAGATPATPPALSPAPATTSPLILEDPSVGLVLELPPGWTATPGPPGIYADPSGAGRLKVTVEDSPLTDPTLVPAAMAEAQRRGIMRVAAEPRLTTVAGYPCVVVASSQSSGGFTVGTLFHHFFVGRREVAFRLVGAGPRWDALTSALGRSLDGLVLRDLPRGGPAGPTVILRDRGLVVTGPPGFRPVEASEADSLARFVAPDEHAVFDVSQQVMPVPDAPRLAALFAARLQESGLTVVSSDAGRSGPWPTVTVEAVGDFDDMRVHSLFRLLLSWGRVFQVAATCPADRRAELWPRFLAAADALRVGPDPLPGDEYRNPSALHLEGTPLSRVTTVTVDVTVAGLVTSLPRATLLVPLPRSLPPFQTVDAIAWSREPDRIAWDEEGNPRAAFFTEGLGRNAREKTTLRLTVRTSSGRVTPGAAGAGLPLPALTVRNLTSPGPNVPSHHPRADELAARWTAGTTTTADLVDALLQGVAREFASGAAVDRRRETWGRGALFALAEPGLAGPSERADLLTALLRDQGLPTRRCYGHLLPERSGERLRTHAWCEVWLPPAGWVPADPTPLTPGAVPVLGLWSDRYLLLGREGPARVVVDGPDSAVVVEGHGVEETTIVPSSIEVVRTATHP